MAPETRREVAQAIGTAPVLMVVLNLTVSHRPLWLTGLPKLTFQPCYNKSSPQVRASVNMGLGRLYDRPRSTVVHRAVRCKIPQDVKTDWNEGSPFGAPLNV